MRYVFGILFLLVLIGVVIWLLNFDVTLKYLFFLRVSLVCGVLLFALPFISAYLVPTMLKNIYVLRTLGQLALVIATAIISGLGIVHVLNTVLENAPARFGVPEWGHLTPLWMYVAAVVLGLPTVIFSTALSVEIKGSGRVWGAVIGLALAAVLLVAFSEATKFLEASSTLEDLVDNIFLLLPEQAQDGYIVQGTNTLTTGHLTTIGFLLVALIVYIYGFFKLRPRLKPAKFQSPALFFVLVILLAMCLVFGGATFFFDLFKIPVFTSFLIIFAVSYRLFNVDHFYRLKSGSGDKPTLDDLPKVLNQRLQDQGDDRTLVVVCASGGGIQAAGWTVQVLTGLQEVLGTAFTRAIGLISAASGGSVGTMYFLDRHSDKGYPKPEDLDQIFESATHDSLDASGWGLAYPDLWRLIGLPFLPPKMLDRGWAIEVDWKSVMKEPRSSFATWRERILNGKIPTPVFNATLVQDGRRFVLSPMTFGDDPLDPYCADFNTLYSDFDIDATTAARLSATFPYVTPICRNSESEPIFHVADGGYFDNFGVFTSVEWLNNHILPKYEELHIKRVLFLEIIAGPDEPEKREGGTANQGWRMAVLGPLLTLFSIRNSTQIARNRADVANLKEIWGKKVEIKNFTIRFPIIDRSLKMDTFVNEKGEYQPPLSWKLTQRQKDAIKKGWEVLRTEAGGVVEQIEAIWKDWAARKSDAA
jgi:hypothetical protein